MSEYTKGKLHRHGLVIDIRKADGDHTRLANMSESSTAYIPVYEKQAANAERLINCWNSHDALLVVSHNLAETMAIDYAIKKLSTITDDNFSLGAATILKGIQQQAKTAIAGEPQTEEV